MPKGYKSNGELVNFRHGGHSINKPEFNSWRAMIERCNNKSYWAYDRYGGRGISVSKTWQRPASFGFTNFLADMGKKPSSRHTLDRIDVDGNYSPSNCRWADPHTQHNNTSRNHFEIVDGERKTVAEWCRQYGTTKGRIENRMKCGWSFEDALKTPVNKNGVNFSRRPSKPIPNCMRCNKKTKDYRRKYCSKKCYIAVRWPS